MKFIDGVKQIINNLVPAFKDEGCTNEDIVESIAFTRRILKKLVFITKDAKTDMDKALEEAEKELKK